MPVQCPVTRAVVSATVTDSGAGVPFKFYWEGGTPGSTPAQIQKCKIHEIWLDLPSHYKKCTHFTVLISSETELSHQTSLTQSQAVMSHGSPSPPPQKNAKHSVK